MDAEKVGRLISQLRREKGLTQRQLADALHISNKAVSKWECGRGVPDVSVWEALAAQLGADILKLLQGELAPNRRDVGKMERISFYVCPVCGNILTSTQQANAACCGRRLAPLQPRAGDNEHSISVEEMDFEYYIHIRHEMTKDHHFAFAAYVSDGAVWFARFYPEQSPSFRMPAMQSRGSLYLYCTRHGLFKFQMDLR